MNTSFQESKWLVASMLLLAGFGVLVLSVARMDERLRMPRRDGSTLPANARNILASSLPESVGDPAALDAASQELTNESDSMEERIRKKYGMVKRAGVWLPAYPISRTGGAVVSEGATSSNDPASPTYAVPLYITTGRLAEGRAWELYQAKIEAVGGVPPYAWSIDSGAPASSLSLGRMTGELSGKASAPVTTSVRIRVTDTAGAADVAEFKLRITAAMDAVPVDASAVAGAKTTVLADGTTTVDPVTQPSADTGDPETSPEEPEKPLPLSIQPGTLTDGIAGKAYTAQFTATGGTPSYLWSAASALPPGIMLSAAGVLSGAPQEPGDFQLGVLVTDQSAQSATQTFSLSIKPAALPVITDFTAFLSLHKIALAWTNPTSASVSSIRILRNSIRPPASETDGIIVYEGTGTSAVDPSLSFGPYFYAAYSLGIDGSVSEPLHLAVELRSDAEPFADQMLDKQLLHANAYNQERLPGIVLGSPDGGGLKSGSMEVVSLGAASVDAPGSAPYGGSIVLGFSNNLVHDGPGKDFTVSENVFYVKGPTGYDPNSRFMEPAIVSVSQEGYTWHTFPFDFSPRYDPVTGALNLRHPYTYNKGFAGVNPVLSNKLNSATLDPTDPTVSGGDSFDLADLHVPGLRWIRYIRIQSTGHKWMADVDGELVHHINDTDTKAADRNSRSAGFDLDAVTAIWLDAAR